MQDNIKETSFWKKIKDLCIMSKIILFVLIIILLILIICLIKHFITNKKYKVNEIVEIVKKNKINEFNVTPILNPKIKNEDLITNLNINDFMISKSDNGSEKEDKIKKIKELVIDNIIVNINLNENKYEISYKEFIDFLKLINEMNDSEKKWQLNSNSRSDFDPIELKAKLNLLSCLSKHNDVMILNNFQDTKVDLWLNFESYETQFACHQGTYIDGIYDNSE